MRRYLPILAALVFSVLLHLLLLEPHWELVGHPPHEPPVIQAQLEPMKPTAPAPLSTPKKVEPPRPKQTRPSRQPHHAVASTPKALASAPIREVPTPEEHSAPPSTPVPETHQVETETTPTPPPPALNAVPARLQITYRISYGPIRGKQVLEWAVNQDRYTLSMVVHATGLAGLFYHGRIIQISTGRIGPQGLIPEEFWDERGDYYAHATFNRKAGEVLLQSNRGLRRYPISPGIQDALSLLLQVALVAPPPQSAEIELFNSKKVRHYLIRNLGEETLDTPLGHIKTVHLAKVNSKPNEETFDIWLAPAYHYLPVKLVRGDPEGLDISLLAENISSSAMNATDVPQPPPEGAQPVRPAASAVRPSDTTP